MLEVSGIHAGYGGSSVLHGVDLRVGNGEAVVMLGPNGHGKTTLLRVISGLLRPRQGTVVFDGKDISRTAPDAIAAMGVTHIPQGDLPFPNMTVEENLLMGAYRKKSWSRRRESFEKVYALFPRLKDRPAQKAKSLSGGERRMLALGRGLMGDTKVLLIDEPSLGLAPLVTEEVYAMIGKIKETGIAILLVDESATHVAGFAEQVYVMGGGRIVKAGSAAEILEDEGLLAAYLG